MVGSRLSVSLLSTGFAGLKLSSLSTSAGFLAFVLSGAVTAAAAYQGVDLTYIHSHFLQLAVASFVVSTLLSVYLYVRSLSAGPAELALGGSSGETPSAVEMLLF